MDATTAEIRYQRWMQVIQDCASQDDPTLVATESPVP